MGAVGEIFYLVPTITEYVKKTSATQHKEAQNGAKRLPIGSHVFKYSSCITHPALLAFLERPCL